MTAKLLIESWRGVPHSYAVVNQRQCLEFLKRRNLLLRHRDLPYFDPAWKPSPDMFDAKDWQAISSIPTPSPDEHFDAAIRISYPYEVTASPQAERTFVFSTCEFTVPTETAFKTRKFELEEGRLEMLTPSNWSKAGLVRYGAAERLVHVVPHGFEPELFKPLPPETRAACRKSFGWEGRFVFLHIGAMTTNKGVLQILKAFAHIAARHPEALLVMKGLDSIYQSMGLLAKSLRDCLTKAEAVRVGERITYIGDALPEAGVARLLQSADVYLSPYLAEGFNMPVLEAAACGLPAICTAGGPTDDFTTGDFNLKVESKLELLPAAGKTCLIPSMESLAAQMERAMSDASWMAKARAAAPAYVNSRFTWSHAADKLLSLTLPDWRDGEI